MKDDFKESIRQKLRALSPRALGVTYEGEAAVLIALFQKRARLHFLLTRRSQEVATHKGQISFPGGLRGPKDESLQVTALRETREELGISACHVDVLGQFHEYRAVTNYLVTAFVGFLEGEYVLSPNPREVESLLEATSGFISTNQAVALYPPPFWEYRFCVFLPLPRG